MKLLIEFFYLTTTTAYIIIDLLAGPAELFNQHEKNDNDLILIRKIFADHIFSLLFLDINITS